MNTPDVRRFCSITSHQPRRLHDERFVSQDTAQRGNGGRTNNDGDNHNISDKNYGVERSALVRSAQNTIRSQQVRQQLADGCSFQPSVPMIV